MLRKFNRGNSKIVPITTDIQIYIRYITAMVDYQGKLNIYKDIYKKENDLIDRLFNNYDSSWIKSSTNPWSNFIRLEDLEYWLFGE